jgi:hypothetical protein
MTKYSWESVFPAPREQLWRVLKLHVDDGQIGRIHPNILSQRQASRAGNRWVLERKVRLFGRSFNITMEVEMEPPEMYRWEIVASDAAPAPGSHVENRYSDAGEETKVSTTAEMTLRGVPGFLQSWVVNRNLNRADGEDLKHLRTMQ